MKEERILINKRHLAEYIFYGGLAALVFMVPAWYFLSSADYNNAWIVYLGCIMFMFVIMFYAFQLSRRRPDYKSTMMMTTAAHIAIAVGVVLSVLASLLLCFIYIPGFMTGHSPDTYLSDAPSYTNHNNFGTLFQIFFPATLVNFGAASFIAILGPYVFKINQTQDKELRIKQ